LDNTKLTISVIDLVALIDSVSKGAAMAEIGFEDADRTLEQLYTALNKPVKIDKELIESALWSANLLNQAGLFRHPLNMSFPNMVSRIVPEGLTYDSFFNLISKGPGYDG
jgi:hypothetical protein